MHVASSHRPAEVEVDPFHRVSSDVVEAAKLLTSLHFTFSLDMTISQEDSAAPMLILALRVRFRVTLHCQLPPPSNGRLDRPEAVGYHIAKGFENIGDALAAEG